jgi:hypothetical protein
MGRGQRDPPLARGAVVGLHRLPGFDLVAAGVSGDLAYLAGFEHIANSVVGIPVEPYTLRVTHIFRREDGERSRRSSSESGPRRGHIGATSLPSVRDNNGNEEARGADVPVCLGRPGGPLAGGRLGKGLHQCPDLGIGVASVATQGAEVGQPALLCPATHRLGRHMKELGDLRCT